MSNFFLDKTILIFGASGFIGSNLTNKIQKYSCNIVRVSRDTNSLKELKNSNANIINIKLDFKDNYFLELVKKADIIYYLSSQTSIYTAQKNIIKDYDDSVKTILILLETLKKFKNKAILIFASSSTVCGLIDKLPVNENIRDNPITIYDIHKETIENYIKFFINENYIYGCILRLANVYGWGIKNANSDRGILNLMIKKSINKENITLYGDGHFVRDYIFVDDVVDAFLNASINIFNTSGKHYIIGSEIGSSIKDAFLIIKDKAMELFNIDINIDEVKMPLNMAKIEYRNFIADSSKFKKDTSWHNKISLRDGIEKTMVFYNENRTLRG